MYGDSFHNTGPHIPECSDKVLRDFQVDRGTKADRGRKWAHSFQNKFPALIASKPQAKWHTKRIYEEQTSCEYS